MTFDRLFVVSDLMYDIMCMYIYIRLRILRCPRCQHLRFPLILSPDRHGYINGSGNSPIPHLHLSSVSSSPPASLGGSTRPHSHQLHDQLDQFQSFAELMVPPSPKAKVNSPNSPNRP